VHTHWSTVRNREETEDGSSLFYDPCEMLDFVFCPASDSLVCHSDNDESEEKKDFSQFLYKNNMPQISKMTLSCLSLLTPNTISLMSEFLP
jgi:hypothetical protein